MANNDEDVLGVYASTTDGKKPTLVIVNKDVFPVNLAISNIPAGTYFMRHFGGAAGVAKWQVSIAQPGVLSQGEILTFLTTDDDHNWREWKSGCSVIHCDLLAATVIDSIRKNSKFLSLGSNGIRCLYTSFCGLFTTSD
jgi:hypothetical protein